jgi:UDP-N-acetylmuramyl pentapeptide synthase
MRVTAEVFADWVKGKLTAAGAGREVQGVSTDSRSLKAGDAFFALKGERFDGHDHVGEAFGKGAILAVVQRAEVLAGRLGIVVGDVKGALGEIGRASCRERVSNFV